MVPFIVVLRRVQRFSLEMCNVNNNYNDHLVTMYSCDHWFGMKISNLTLSSKVLGLKH